MVSDISPNLHFPGFCWALLSPFTHPLGLPFPHVEAQGILSYGVCVSGDVNAGTPTSSFFTLSHLESVLFSQFIFLQQFFPGNDVLAWSLVTSVADAPP